MPSTGAFHGLLPRAPSTGAFHGSWTQEGICKLPAKSRNPWSRTKRRNAREPGKQQTEALPPTFSKGLKGQDKRLLKAFCNKTSQPRSRLRKPTRGFHIYEAPGHSLVEAGANRT